MNLLYLEITPSLYLQAWEVDMTPSLFALVDRNREHLRPWLPWVPFVKQEKDSEKFILDSQKNWENQTALELGIWQDDQLVGCIGLHELNRLHRRTSLGYWLGAEFQGKGIMTRSVATVVKYCFEVQEFHRVEIRAAVQNTASRAIPERLGFTQEGILHEAELVDGKYLDSVVYSKLSSE